MKIFISFLISFVVASALNAQDTNESSDNQFIQLQGKYKIDSSTCIAQYSREENNKLVEQTSTHCDFENFTVLCGKDMTGRNECWFTLSTPGKQTKVISSSRINEQVSYTGHSSKIFAYYSGSLDDARWTNRGSWSYRFSQFEYQSESQFEWLRFKTDPESEKYIFTYNNTRNLHVADQVSNNRSSSTFHSIDFDFSK